MASPGFLGTSLSASMTLAAAFLVFIALKAHRSAANEKPTRTVLVLEIAILKGRIVILPFSRTPEH